MHENHTQLVFYRQLLVQAFFALKSQAAATTDHSADLMMVGKMLVTRKRVQNDRKFISIRPCNGRSNLTAELSFLPVPDPSHFFGQKQEQTF